MSDKHSADNTHIQPYTLFVGLSLTNTNNVKETRSYSLTITFCRTTRGLLITKRASIFYKLPTLPPDLVHHSLSQVKSRVHRSAPGNQTYATLRANQRPAGVTSYLPERRHTVPMHVTKSSFRVEQQSKCSSGALLQPAEMWV